jgi:hypothetical protein
MGDRLYSSERALRFSTPCRLEGVRDGVGWPEYEKRFLWGVDGVPDGGGNDTVVLAGGVCERPDLRKFPLSVGDRL